MWLRRLILAPNWPRSSPILSSESVNLSIMSWAPVMVVISVPETAPETLPLVYDWETSSIPLASVVRLPETFSARVSSLVAPIWKDTSASNLPLVPSLLNSFSPAKLLFSMILLSSLPSSLYSACIALRSASLLVPLADWVARSFMRCMISVISLSAPSAVCSSEEASLTLRRATAMPLVCAFMRVAICRPAASSAAELMRRPVPRRCWLVARALLVLFRLVWVSSDE